MEQPKIMNISLLRDRVNILNALTIVSPVLVRECCKWFVSIHGKNLLKAEGVVYVYKRVLIGGYSYTV